MPFRFGSRRNLEGEIVRLKAEVRSLQNLVYDELVYCDRGKRR